MAASKALIAALAIVSCAALVRAQQVQPPAPLQCTAANLVKCRYASLNACGATEWPAQQTENPCCPNAPSCRLPTACNETVIRTCDIAHMQVCAQNQDGTPGVPTRADANACCPSCRPAPPRADRCTTDPEDIPRCAPGTVPAIVPATGCFNCRPADGRVGNCTLSALTQCAQTFASLPDCTNNADPERENQDDSNPLSGPPARPCCLTCKPNYLRTCNATTIAQCHRQHDALPLCGAGAGVRAAFNKPNCCRTCRRQPPASGNGPDMNGRCTFAQLRTCFASAPVCEDGERPFVSNTTFCCPECRRAERTCSIEDVVRCRANQPSCAAGELPTHVDGECCATCAPVKAACSCDTATQVCVYARDVTLAPTCAPKLTVTFRLAPAAANTDAISFMTAAEIGHLIREMVARYCDHNANDARCQRRGTQIRNSDFAYVANGDGSYTITVTYPDVSDDAVVSGGSDQPTQAVVHAAQVLTISTSADAGIYFDAAADAESGDGYSASDNSAASPRAAAAGLSVVMAVAAAYAMGAF